MTTTVSSVRAEYRSDQPWVGVPAPRLTWKTTTDAPGWLQASAELEVSGDRGTSTATVSGRHSVLVDWPFAPLAPREVVAVRVRVTGEDGAVSDWSAPLAIVGGFLADGEWAAQMIGSATETPKKPALVRTEVTLDGDIARATLYATAHGAYQVSINGVEVDDQILKPGWTSYQWHLAHETTDVTALVRGGENAIGIEIAGAWFTESFGFRDGARGFYGSRPAVAAQLVVEYVDGRTETILTDGTWLASDDGPRTDSGIYRGEDYDATKTMTGWAENGFDTTSWSPVRVEDEAHPVPRPRTAPAVRAIEEVAVQEVITTPAGKTVVDFGQNLVGRLRIRVRGEAGRTVTLRHAEVLEHGELGVRPLRAAAATDRYTLAGGADEVWEPRFTFHGFRYAELENWPGEFDPADVTAVVIHSDMQRTGWFESSHALVNRLHENVVWGMRGNFVYLPTDCPQRDERLGWTGDIQVFSPTASFLYDSDGFLSGWLEDVWLEQQHADGIVPFVVPSVLGEHPAAAWGDAGTVVPSVLYERFGDVGTLRARFPGMKAWSDHVLALAGETLLWEDHFQFGDWLDPDAHPDRPADAKTDADIIATAYLYRSVDLTARAAEVLGESADAAHYGDLATRIKAAFLAEYTTASGRMMSDAQTGYATAIMFGLYADDAQKQAFGDRLAFLTRANGYHIGTGFVGTPLIEDALTVTGHTDIGARLLVQTENPSWLYPVTMGATTIWERWDSMLEDGTINPGEMTSFNHYALGAVADWLQRSLAGLAPAEPGYRALEIAPQPIDGFEFAKATHETPYGLAETGWTRDGDSVTVTAVVPANTTAHVTLPDGTTHEVGSGTHSWTVTAPTVGAPRAELTIDSSLAAIVDDREAYAVVLAAIAANDGDKSEAFRKHTKWTAGTVLRDSLAHGYSQASNRAISAALDELNKSRV